MPLPREILDDFLNKCMPVIVSVVNQKTGGLHWVVVTGTSGSDYTINDPGFRAQDKLSGYGDIYGIRVYKDNYGGCQ